jgi:hypothetical protein
LASRSATASESSAKAGSNVLSGNEARSPCTLLRAESRNEERDEGRRGVVGREREVERARRWELSSCAILGVCGRGHLRGCGRW